MGPQSTQLERRRRVYEVLAARIAALSDDQLGALVPDTGSWPANVHGNQSGVVDIEGAKVFVKKIALTELERTAENQSSTANLFGLPMFYHYGVGSAGFGAWRELRACVTASGWVLAGECPHFPLVYHWRVLPRAAPPLTEKQLAWLKRAPAYWESGAVGARLDAVRAAGASIVIVMEYVPHRLDGWLRDRPSGEAVDAALEAAVLRLHDQLRRTTAFMNDRGMLHFDLNRSNVLTDGEAVYAADFGLALCADFDLAPDERAFFETHRLYDRAYVTWALMEWLVPKEDPPALTPALRELVDRCAPVAARFGSFLDTVQKETKTAPYPAAELKAALAAQAWSTPELSPAWANRPRDVRP